jgi:hypothetical protein
MIPRVSCPTVPKFGVLATLRSGPCAFSRFARVLAQETNIKLKAIKINDFMGSSLFGPIQGQLKDYASQNMPEGGDGFSGDCVVLETKRTPEEVRNGLFSQVSIAFQAVLIEISEIHTFARTDLSALHLHVDVGFHGLRHGFRVVLQSL